MTSGSRGAVLLLAIVGAACGSSGASPGESAAMKDAGGTAPQHEFDAGRSHDASMAAPPGNRGAPDAMTGVDDLDASTGDGGAATESDSEAGLSGGALPPVTDPGQMGPFKVTTQMSTGPSSNYTLYYPESIATDGYAHPSFVWGNGALATPSNYTTLLDTIASNGFVIIEYNSTPGGQQMTDALDWLVAQNDAQGSVLYHHLDTSKMAAGGHSAGSLAVFAIASDPRVITTVHLSGGTMSPHTDLANLRHPALFVCGDTPTGLGLTTGDVANPNCEYDFQNATVPVFYGMQKGASHLSTYDGIGDDKQRTQFARAIIAWLAWKVAGQQALSTTFAGSSCTLCTDPAWTVEQRGL